MIYFVTVLTVVVLGLVLWNIKRMDTLCKNIDSIRLDSLQKNLDSVKQELSGKIESTLSVVKANIEESVKSADSESKNEDNFEYKFEPGSKFAYEVDGDDVIEIICEDPASSFKSKKGTEINANDAFKKKIWNVAELALGKAGAQALSHYGSVTLKFPKEILAGEAAGIYKLAGNGTRAIMKNVATGEIASHAKIVSSMSMANLAFVLTAAWQVAAMVTAQHYLHEINSKLNEIKNGIQEIKDFLEEQEQGKLLGNITYMQKVYKALQSFEFSHIEAAAFINQLETIERDCEEVINRTEIRIRKTFDNMEINRLEKLKKDEAINAVKKCNDQIEKHLQYYILVINTHILNCQLKSALPVSQEWVNYCFDLVSKRISDIRKLLINARNNIEKPKESDRFRHFINQDRAINEYNEKVDNFSKELNNNVGDKINDNVSYLISTRKLFDRKQEFLNKPIFINLQYENGNIKTAKLIEKTAVLVKN